MISIVTFSFLNQSLFVVEIYTLLLVFLQGWIQGGVFGVSRFIREAKRMMYWYNKNTLKCIIS